MATLIIAPDVTTGDVPCLHDENVGVVKNAEENVGVVSKSNKRKLGQIDFPDEGGTVTKKPHPCPPIKSSNSGTADTNNKHSHSSKQESNHDD